MMSFSEKIGSKETGGWINTALTILQIFFLVALGWVVIRSILLLSNPESAWVALPNVSSVNQNSSSAGERIYDFSTNPFRLPSFSETEPLVKTEGFDAPETNLNIRLLGRFAGASQIAVLRTPDNREESYSIGEEVMNGVTLQNVYSDFVVLKVNGEIQRLTFQRDDKSNLAGAMSQNSSQTMSVRPTSSQQNHLVTTNSIQKRDVTELIKSVRLNPNFKTGKFTGYEIKGRNGATSLNQFGLQSGDIITAVNGESLLSGQPDLPGLVAKLRNKKTINLDILRDGRAVTVQIGS